MKTLKPVDKKLKEFVKDCVKKSAYNIGVTHFTIDIHYMSEDKNDEERNETISAETSTQRRYLRAVIKIYPYVERQWKKGEIEDVRETIHHEVSHLATQHVMDLMVSCYKDEGETKDAWETLTQVVAKMSLKIDELENKK
jgi:hypothetical protein